MHYGRLGIFLGCLMVVGGISGAINQKNFTSIMETQEFIETTIQLQTLHIKQKIPYATIYQVLEQQCDATSLKEAQTLFEVMKTSRITHLTPSTLKTEMEKRFTLLKNLIPTLKTKDENLFCKQKYLTYSLLEYTQNLYLGTSTPIFPVIPQKQSPTPPLVQTPVEQVLEPTHESADTLEAIQYLRLVNNTQSLTGKGENIIAQLAEMYIQKEVGRLISLGFLQPNDIEILNDKVELSYLSGCGITQGSYHMVQKTDGSNRRFKGIKLNVNLCSKQSYITNFDTYVRQLFIHELGHYLYYFKDKFTTTFDTICWKQGKTNCTTEDFVSTYAQKNKEEDYAESFAHWYLETIAGDTMIVDKEHGSAEVSSPTKTAKHQYFTYVYTPPTTNL